MTDRQIARAAVGEALCLLGLALVHALGLHLPRLRLADRINAALCPRLLSWCMSAGFGAVVGFNLGSAAFMGFA